MSQIIPSSKMALKLSCLSACGNDVDKAARLYDYLVSDLHDLPDCEPEKLSGVQQVMASADNVMGWIGQHQEEILQGINLIRSLKGAPMSPAAPINLQAIPKP